MEKSSPPSSPLPLPLPPLPTTFVQADPTSFKQTVQLLTGSAETAAARASSSSSSQHVSKNPIPPLSRPKKPSFKLYERRPSLKNLNMISPFCPSPADVTTTRSPPPVSPSVLDFPSLTLSPVTPLTSDPLFDRSPSNLGAEERGILEKGFYLHPSPRSAEPPRLLPLFPLSSPRGSSA